MDDTCWCLLFFFGVQPDNVPGSKDGRDEGVHASPLRHPHLWKSYRLSHVSHKGQQRCDEHDQLNTLTAFLWPVSSLLQNVVSIYMDLYTEHTKATGSTSSFESCMFPWVDSLRLDCPCQKDWAWSFLELQFLDQCHANWRNSGICNLHDNFSKECPIFGGTGVGSQCFLLLASLHGREPF